jgi:hypothetical protein
MVDKHVGGILSYEQPNAAIDFFYSEYQRSLGLIVFGLKEKAHSSMQKEWACSDIECQLFLRRFFRGLFQLLPLILAQL